MKTALMQYVILLTFLPLVCAQVPETEEFTWILAMAVIMCLLCAYGIGANDVSNSFASAIGAKALTLRQGVVLAAIFEFLGSILAGAAVADTIRGGIANQKEFESRPELLMFGMMIVDLTAGVWLIAATMWELPVSTTHSAVGAIIGMSIACAGWDAVVWYKSVNDFPYVGGLSGIILGWVISPVIAGGFSAVLFGLTKICVLSRQEPFKAAKLAFPIYTFIAIWVACNAVVSKGLPQQKAEISKLAGGLDGAAAWISVIVAFGFAVLAATVGNSWINRKIQEEDSEYSSRCAHKQKSVGSISSDLGEKIVRRVTVKSVGKDIGLFQPIVSKRDEEHRFFGPCGGPLVPSFIKNNFLYKWINDGLDYDLFSCIDDDEAVQDTHSTCKEYDFKTEQVYRYLQVFTSCFNMFAHGSNDVANSIGPFAAVYLVWRTGSVVAKSPVEQWILAVGGLTMSLGVMTYGYKIIQVMGVKMTKISNTRGLCIDMASAIVVIIASKYGLPVSSTQTVTGAIIGVGMLDGQSGVNWKVMMKVFAGWAMTIIFTGFTAAILTSWSVYAPHRNSVERRVALAQSMAKSSNTFGIALNNSASKQAQEWGKEVLSQASKIKAPIWSADPAFKTMTYTCERGFLQAGLINVNQTSGKK